MQFYRFSPIETEAELKRAIDYIVSHTTKLFKKVTGKTYEIPYLTIFSHYKDEYENLKILIESMGVPQLANNGVAVRLSKPIKVGEYYIPKLRVRKPDPYRAQVGCNDFRVSDYKIFKEELFKSTKKDNFRVIDRQKDEMIEFFDPDVDVLAYVVGEKTK